MRHEVNARELIEKGRFGPIGPGATFESVRDALGDPDTRSRPGALVEPASIWVYGKSVCRGHLEFHFLQDRLWMIFADYLPLRPCRAPQFRFDPDCLGGLVYPSAAEVLQSFASGGSPAPTLERLDARWSDPPPPDSQDARISRIGTRDWNRAVRKARATEVQTASYARLIWPSGSSLGIGYHHAVSAAGERLVSEDVIVVMTVPMDRDEA